MENKSGREILKHLLGQCSGPQQRMFKLMYGRNGGKRSVEDAEKLDINECVDLMEENRIEWAITQCENTLDKAIKIPRGAVNTN